MPTVTLTSVVEEIRTSQCGAFVELVEDQGCYVSTAKVAAVERAASRFCPVSSAAFHLFVLPIFTSRCCTVKAMKHQQG